MDDDTLKNFARQLDVDSEEVLERWQGRPDRIIDDIFRVEDIDTGQPRELELFDVQRKVVHAYFYGDAGTLNAYKGRRIGYSFVVVACFLLEGLFYPNSFYPIVSRSLSQSKDRISDITTLIENAKIEIPTEKTNTDEIELWNGSRFMAYSADSDTSRGGDSARAVLMDEMAFIEHEEQARRAFGAFLSLGENRKMVEISTPNTRNDLFMKNHRKGSPDGENGVISIKQPTFANAEEIDIHKPLYEQEVEPVRPELNIDQIETERMSDPEGFAQEYLCRPVVNEYRFFDEESVDRAMQRALRDDYATGLAAPKQNKRRVMGVDIGINRDDTVLSIMDHAEKRRQQRELIVADDDVLRQAGVRDPDRGNANHIAQLIAYVYNEMDVDLVVMDKGGVGQTFQRIIERKLGRSVIGFDFSDGEGLENMMGDTNAALRNNQMVLVHDDRLRDEMCAIVKEKNKEHTRASFSGKENSESGKDDTAMATALSAFPPQLSEGHATSPSYKPQEDVVETPKTISTKDDAKPDGKYNPSYGATSVARGTRSRKNRYRSRRTR